MNSDKLVKSISIVRQSRSFIALLTTLLVQVGFIHFTLAKPAPTPASKQLSAIEERLFFRDFTDEDEASRLSRIEKEIFGESHSGETNERLNSINLALPASPKADQDLPKAGTPPEAGAGDRGEAVLGKPPSSRPERPAFQSDNPAQDGDEQKLAVLAAKQKEIDDLLAQGVALWKAKKAEEAIEKFTQVVRLDAQNSQAYFSLGVALEAQGNVAQAKENYQQAHMLEPGNKDFNLALEAIDKKLERNEKFDQQQSQWHELANDAASAYQRGEYLSALDLYKQLDEKAPNQAIVKWNIGSLYLIIKNPIMAVQYYKQAVKLKPDDERYRHELKQLEENIKAEQGKQKEANDAWKNASQSGNNKQDLKQQAEHEAKSKAKAKETNLLLYYGIAAKHHNDGARITRIEQGSRAAQVGLKVDDVIKAVDGAVTTDGEEINRILQSKPPGARFQFTVQRGARMGQILF